MPRLQKLRIPKEVMNGQTKAHSFLEAVLNVAIGFGVSIVGQLVIFPLVGLPPVSAVQHLHIAFWFTLLSITRTYLLRRWFNSWMVKLHLRVEKKTDQRTAEQGPRTFADLFKHSKYCIYDITHSPTNPLVGRVNNPVGVDRRNRVFAKFKSDMGYEVLYVSY